MTFKHDLASEGRYFTCFGFWEIILILVFWGLVSYGFPYWPTLIGLGYLIGGLFAFITLAPLDSIPKWIQSLRPPPRKQSLPRSLEDTYKTFCGNAIPMPPKQYQFCTCIDPNYQPIASFSKGKPQTKKYEPELKFQVLGVPEIEERLDKLDKELKTHGTSWFNKPSPLWTPQNDPRTREQYYREKDSLQSMKEQYYLSEASSKALQKSLEEYMKKAKNTFYLKSGTVAELSPNSPLKTLTPLSSKKPEVNED